jgi:hypothetical protein
MGQFVVAHTEVHTDSSLFCLTYYQFCVIVTLKMVPDV